MEVMRKCQEIPVVERLGIQLDVLNKQSSLDVGEEPVSREFTHPCFHSFIH